MLQNITHRILKDTDFTLNEILFETMSTLDCFFFMNNLKINNKQ